MQYRHRALLAAALSLALGAPSLALAQAQEIAIDPKAFFDRAASEGKFQEFDQAARWSKSFRPSPPGGSRRSS